MGVGVQLNFHLSLHVDSGLGSGLNSGVVSGVSGVPVGLWYSCVDLGVISMDSGVPVGPRSRVGREKSNRDSVWMDGVQGAGIINFLG